MYGLNIETSDIDVVFIYALNSNDILKGINKPQINISKDIKGCEIGRYLELLGKNNPNIIESLFVPEDCLLYEDPIMKMINDGNWITEKFKRSVLGYIKAQLKKKQQG